MAQCLCLRLTHLLFQHPRISGVVATATWHFICMARRMHALRGLGCVAFCLISFACGGQSESTPDGDKSAVGGESSGGADPTNTSQAGESSTSDGGAPTSAGAPTWRAFLDNHLKDLVSIDFFVVPTATFRVLFGLLILARDRRCVLHFNVTSSPSAAWTAQQVVQAFPEESAPRYLLRDRDGTYGRYFRRRVRDLGIKEVLIAARSPWQSP